MEKPAKEMIYSSLKLHTKKSDLMRESENVDSYKDRIQRKYEHKEQYKAAVKEYTSILIGRKIPENCPTFNEKEIENGKMIVKSPKILRMLTKWCEELWKKFSEVNYYSNRSELIKVQRGGNVNSLLAWMRKSLDKLMAAEKKNIDKYMGELIENNYHMQASILAR